MNIIEEFEKARVLAYDKADQYAGRANRWAREIKHSLNRSAGQRYRQAKARLILRGSL